MKGMRLALVLLAFAVVFPATAHGQTTSAEAPICEFGLVLSGGGARGIAHIGVLEVFEQEGIVPDCIVGASMGSIVGSLYAAGHTIDEILQLMDVLSWRSLFTEPVNRSAQPIVHRLDAQRTALRLGLADGALRFPPSALNDSMINRLLIEALAPANFQAGRDFAALPIPFRTVGTDLRSGNRIVLREGDLARAVRASMSVPLAYSPVEWGDALLVDGGLADNLPVSLAREMGATFVVAIDVSTPITDDIATDMVGVTKRIVDLLFAAKNSLYREPPELTIVPELHDHGFADYSEFDHLIEAGRTAARAAIDSIPERYRGRSTERPRIRDIGRRTVASVEVTGTHFLKPSLMAHELGVEAGEQLDFKRALDGLDQVNSTGLVQKAWVDIRDVGNDQVVVALHVVEDYRHTADLGLAYQSDDQVQGFLRFETKSPFGAGERLRLTAYGSGRDTLLSAGLRSAELFGVHLGYHVAFDFHEEKPKVFGDEGHFITRAEFQRQHVKVLFDFPFGTRHVFETGFRLGTLKFREQLGLTYPEDSFRQRVLVGRYVWDDLDSLVLPTRGRFIRALAEYNAESLGADIGYLFVDLYARDAWTLGPLMFEARLRYGYGSDDLPLSEQFRIGGPELIPGVARDERWGKQALAASLTVGRDLYSLLRVYGRVGGGNVWDRQREINWNGAILGAGLGATLATPLGPMQLDYGWAQGGRNRLVLSFGWQTQWVRDISR